MSTAPAADRLTLTSWLIIFIAAVGFLFDTYELLMLPLILPQAMGELGAASPDAITIGQMHIPINWRGVMFFVPALAGGTFGLLGGWLTDRLGRRRVLTGSILLYACSVFLEGCSTSLPMLLLFRTFTFVGVCVEFVAATAWLAELFPHGARRESVLGWTQAFGSLGGLCVALVNGWLAGKPGAPGLADSLPAIQIPGPLIDWLGQVKNPHAVWRYTLMSGLIPAIPLILIRPFLPESPAWQAKRAAGTLRRPSYAELFAPGLARTTVVCTLMMACTFGVAFGAIQQLPQIVPGLPQVAEVILENEEVTKANQRYSEANQRLGQMRLGMAGGTPAAAELEKQVGVFKGQWLTLKRNAEQPWISRLSSRQEMGGLAGRIVLAVLAVFIVSRRLLLAVYLVPLLLIAPYVFAVLGTTDWDRLTIGVPVVAALTIGQMSFWGNYLPRVFPLHLRGTGESFAANVGGRMIGSSMAFVTSYIANDALFSSFVSGGVETRFAYAAAGVATAVVLIALIALGFLPEPRRDGLPE